MSASSRYEDRWQHGGEPLCRKVVEREAIERQRQERGIPDEVAEPRAGEARRPLHVEAPDLEMVAGIFDRRRLPDPPQLPDVLLGRAVRHRRAADSAPGARGVPFGLRGGELVLGSPCSSSLPLELLALLGVGFPLQLRSRPRSRRRGHGTRQRSSAASRRSNASSAPLRASAAPLASGSLRAALRSITGLSLGRPPGSRDALACGPAHVVGDRVEARVRVLDRDPKPEASRSSTSFSPSPKATTLARSRPSPAATNASPVPFVFAGCRARGGAGARGEVDPLADLGSRSPRTSASPAGFATATTLVGGPFQPGLEVADLGHAAGVGNPQ